MVLSESNLPNFTHWWKVISVLHVSIFSSFLFLSSFFVVPFPSLLSFFFFSFSSHSFSFHLLSILFSIHSFSYHRSQCHCHDGDWHPGGTPCRGRPCHSFRTCTQACLTTCTSSSLVLTRLLSTRWCLLTSASSPIPQHRCIFILK